MAINSNTQKKIQELQSHEQVLQNILMQKQTLQIELNETNNALTELSNYNGEVFKILGGIMIKSDSEKIKKELNEGKKNLDMHINALDKQEKDISSKAIKLREEITSSINAQKK